jgi:hypothetical protein
MTCHEFRSYFDDPQRGGLIAESAIITEHAALCSDCRRFLEEQRELGATLRSLRDSVPEIPGSLDVAVLAAYHRHVAVEPQSAHATVASGRTRFIPVLAWTAAIAVASVVAGAELRFLWPTQDAAIPASQPAPAQVAPQTPRHEISAPHPPRSSRYLARTTTLRQASPAPHSSGNQQTSAQADSSIASASDPLPVGFRSLMYCDALSCGGPMQMIRVELPPSAAGLGRGAMATSEVVYADVLVGPDGIARGIRILK